MNEAQVTMVGYVASTPSLVVTKAGRFVANMRVGVTPRRQDRDTGQWSDGDTSYVTVTCWRSLATNVAACLRKGDPVVVKGRMRVRQYDDKDGNQRVAVEVDASTLGHDLTRGVAHFLRTKRSPGDAPALQLVQRPGGADPSAAGDDGFEPGGDLADSWEEPSAGERPADVRLPDGAPDETPDEARGDPRPGPGHAPYDEFSPADLFDDAGVEASSVGVVTGSDAPVREVRDRADPVSGGETAAQPAGRAA